MFLYLADNNENACFRTQAVVPRRFRGTLPDCRMLRLAMKDWHHTLPHAIIIAAGMASRVDTLTRDRVK